MIISNKLHNSKSLTNYFFFKYINFMIFQFLSRLTEFIYYIINTLKYNDINNNS